MATKGKKFKWVRIANKYGVKNWTSYELFIEGRTKRVAIVEKNKRGSYYTAIVDFNKDGYNGRFLGLDKSGNIVAMPYLDDIKKAVEKH